MWQIASISLSVRQTICTSLRMIMLPHILHRCTLRYRNEWRFAFCRWTPAWQYFNNIIQLVPWQEICHSPVFLLNFIAVRICRRLWWVGLSVFAISDENRFLQMTIGPTSQSKDLCMSTICVHNPCCSVLETLCAVLKYSWHF